ncbi:MULTISPECIES: antitoxin VbhA family protein [Afifella]|uniref:antitoxin VbhA family protein n=1 Tax=Afifella TaxID=643217 RepID=UPI000FE43491|nr:MULTISPECIES: antitoxin VbhA family protein [Afifella]MCT8268565.1 antitoxin VbhA family protein [Afifella sp. JA880]
MNVEQKRPDRSPEAVERRRRAVEEAAAANYRQGLSPSPAYAAAMEQFVSGEITMEELHAIGRQV